MELCGVEGGASSFWWWCSSRGDVVFVLGIIQLVNLPFPPVQGLNLTSVEIEWFRVAAIVVFTAKGIT